jgi:hypothetical protein
MDLLQLAAEVKLSQRRNFCCPPARNQLLPAHSQSKTGREDKPAPNGLAKSYA